MPSVSSKSSQSNPQIGNTSDFLQDPLKHAVSVMEKKLRNLEKRKVRGKSPRGLDITVFPCKFLLHV